MVRVVGPGGRPPQYRGPTGFCEKHQRKYELYLGCGACYAERPPAPGPSEEEKAAQKKRLDRIRGLVEKAVAGIGDADGEG